MVKVNKINKKKLAELDYPCESSNQLDVKLHTMNVRQQFPMNIDVINSIAPKSPSKNLVHKL